MKTVNIKGKEYVEVNERIKEFRTNKDYEAWTLLSEIISCDSGVCIMKATILDAENHVRATGHAYEKEGSTFINKTSYIENCETSAWGRALGNLGIGIDTSIASSNEVENAIANQNNKPKGNIAKPECPDEQINKALDAIAKGNISKENALKKLINTFDLTIEQKKNFE